MCVCAYYIKTIASIIIQSQSHNTRANTTNTFFLSFFFDRAQLVRWPSTKMYLNIWGKCPKRMYETCTWNEWISSTNNTGDKPMRVCVCVCWVYWAIAKFQFYLFDFSILISVFDFADFHVRKKQTRLESVVVVFSVVPNGSNN